MFIPTKMPNIALISNMNFRRRFNEINKESLSESISPANHDATPTFLYALKLFILAYFCMIAIDVILHYITIMRIKMRIQKEQESPDFNPSPEQEPESPDLTPLTPPSTPELNKSGMKTPPGAPKKNKLSKSGLILNVEECKPVASRTRSMTNRHRRKRGLDLFS